MSYLTSVKVWFDGSIPFELNEEYKLENEILLFIASENDNEEYDFELRNTCYNLDNSIEFELSSLHTDHIIWQIETVSDFFKLYVNELTGYEVDTMKTIEHMSKTLEDLE